MKPDTNQQTKKQKTKLAEILNIYMAVINVNFIQFSCCFGDRKKIMQIEQNAFKMIKDGMSRDSKKENSKPKPCVFFYTFIRFSSALKTLFH